jgi:excisionase family DNA binding protein
MEAFLDDYCFYKIKEVSEILKVDPVTIRRWCKDGILNAKKIGKSWYISKYDLDLLVGNREEKTLMRKE